LPPLCMSWQVINARLPCAKRMKNALFHIFNNNSTTRHRIVVIPSFPESPAHEPSIHVSGLKIGQLFVFWCLALPSLLFRPTAPFLQRVGLDTPMAEPTPFLFAGLPLPTNATTGFSDTLNTDSDTSSADFCLFTIKQDRYTYLTRTFAHTSTISHPILPKHSANESSSSI
jgi:hypothetical protein